MRTGKKTPAPAIPHAKAQSPQRKTIFGIKASLYAALVVGAATALMAADVPAQPVDISKLPEGVKRLDLFLLMGQSNMKGRGVVPADQKLNPRIVSMQMKSDKWVVASDPLHIDGRVDPLDRASNAGVGPGLSFAQALASREPDVMIGLIPCAIGGSKVGQWQKGVNRSLYDEALRRAKLALEQGPPGKTRLCAALWLQGESDTKEALYANYQTQLLKVVDNLRSDLNLPELPFIACTIGSFIEGKGPYPHVKDINAVLLDLPKQRPQTACVDARDLTGNIGDNLHYNTGSQVVIGPRYAEKYLALINSKGAR